MRTKTAKKVITLQRTMSKKGRQLFRGKKQVTPSVATPGDTNLVTPLSAKIMFLTSGEICPMTGRCNAAHMARCFMWLKAHRKNSIAPLSALSSISVPSALEMYTI